jgi:histone H3/H4
MGKPFFVKSAIKEYAKSKGYNVGSDSYDALNGEIKAILDAAFKRTKQNKRKTLKAYDL